MVHMDISIIILNYKSKRLVRQCIKTIFLYNPKLSFEIIVVDNHSEDGVVEMVREQFPGVICIASPENVGYAAGNNLGIKRSQGRYVVIMNPDITLRPGSLEIMVAAMDADKTIGILGPKLEQPDGSLDTSCYRFPSYSVPFYRRTPFGKFSFGKRVVAEYLMDDYDHKEAKDVDWLLGAVLLVRRSALDKVGLLDASFFLYFEDTDWCRRFWRAGYRVVYFPAATMVHYHERLSAQGLWFLSPLRKSTRIHITSCIKYFWKWKKIQDASEKGKLHSHV